MYLVNYVGYLVVGGRKRYSFEQRKFRSKDRLVRFLKYMEAVGCQWYDEVVVVVSKGEKHKVFEFKYEGV